jgi:parallel beta-helix repeat protein
MEGKRLIQKVCAAGIIVVVLMGVLGPAMAHDVQKKPNSVFTGQWLYVGGSGPGNYTKIQDAVDNASDGDTVFVYSGMYYESLLINKTIDLLGEKNTSTIIDAGGSGSGIIVSSNSVTIAGFTVQNSGTIWPDSGIRLYYANDSRITDNIIFNTHSGIEIFFSHNNTIMGNTAVYNNRSINVGYSNDNLIMGNTASSSENGIWVDFSIGNTLEGNTAQANTKRGIILTTDSDDNIITGNIVLNNQYGIYLSYSHGNLITDNHVAYNDEGITLQISYNNLIVENLVVNNSQGIGLFLHSHDNQCYHNTFRNNTQQAYDEENNSWYNRYPSCGNYWDDYTGDDEFWGPNQTKNGADGVGDTPRAITGGDNQDRYPSMEPYGMTQLSFSPFLGGFGLSGKIINIGNTTAFRVCFSGLFTGGFIFVGKETTQEIPKPLLPGEEASVKVFVLGFGKTTLTLSCWAENAPLISGSWPMTVLLFFIIGIHQ